MSVFLTVFIPVDDVYSTSFDYTLLKIQYHSCNISIASVLCTQFFKGGFKWLRLVNLPPWLDSYIMSISLM